MLEHKPRPPLPPPWKEFAASPLVPVALSAGIGLLIDRFFEPPLHLLALLAAAGVVSAVIGYFRSHQYATMGFCLAAAAMAAIHHHTHRNVFPADDVGRFADEQPLIVRVRGLLDETPVLRRSSTEGFGPLQRVDRATAVLDATELRDGSGVWHPVSGRLRISVEQIAGPNEQPPLTGIFVGDEIEMTGLLSRPSPTGNPGEWDYAEYLRDERIRGELRATKADDTVTRLNDHGRAFAILARLRGTFAKRIDEIFPPREAALARALLIGDTSAMDRDEWDAFARTGVVHVLAISGQHLVILAGFVWWTLLIFGVRRRRGAIAVIVLIVAYAILSGLRPSALRAAVMVVLICSSIVSRKPVQSANMFAIAFLLVIAWNPTDLFNTGCQLSFVSVFVLMWGISRWLAPRELTPLEQLLAESRSNISKFLHHLGHWLLVFFAITAILTITNAPLIMMRQNLVPTIGILIGPPLIILTAIALVAGFIVLILGNLPVIGWLAITALSWSDGIVHWADQIPGSSRYVPTPAYWWTVGFYLLLACGILLADRRFALALLAWLAFGLVGLPRTNSDELRVTFLAVGHGGCTVLETPDGRTLLYDAGTMAGPDTVRRIIAPFLWSRGINRIDELFLSHADLDHFNGVSELSRRFPIGQVTMTPSFATKDTPEVANVLLALRDRAIPRRIASAGDRFTCGTVSLSVLHPPIEGPDGVENERSLVLHVEHGTHSFLLTGDLEKSGMTRVLGLPPVDCDILMAPHHGSRSAFPPQLLYWCSPELVVVNRGNRPESAVRAGDAGAAPVWDTWTAGAIIVRSHSSGLTAEAFRRKERIVVKRGR